MTPTVIQIRTMIRRLKRVTHTIDQSIAPPSDSSTITLGKNKVALYRQKMHSPQPMPASSSVQSRKRHARSCDLESSQIQNRRPAHKSHQAICQQ
jgi:acyl-CoA thioesterase FadM